MLEYPFRNKADTVAGGKSVPGGCQWRELPDRIIVQCVHVDAALQKISRRLGQFVQGILQSVIHLFEQSGPERNAQKGVGEFHGISDLQPRRTFKHLKVGTAASHPDDFAFEFQISQNGVRDFVLRDGRVELHSQQIAVYSGNASSFVFKHDRIFSAFSIVIFSIYFYCAVCPLCPLFPTADAARSRFSDAMPDARFCHFSAISSLQR